MLQKQQNNNKMRVIRNFQQAILASATFSYDFVKRMKNISELDFQIHMLLNIQQLHDDTYNT